MEQKTGVYPKDRQEEPFPMELLEHFRDKLLQHFPHKALML